MIRDDLLSCLVGELGAAALLVGGGTREPEPPPAASETPSSSPVSQSRGGLLFGAAGDDGARRYEGRPCACNDWRRDNPLDVDVLVLELDASDNIPPVLPVELGARPVDRLKLFEAPPFT